MTTATTAEIAKGLSLSTGSVWLLSVERDRKPLSRGGLGKGQKGGSLVADTLVGLLRMAADYMEQEGIEDLDGLSDALKEAAIKPVSFPA